MEEHNLPLLGFRTLSTLENIEEEGSSPSPEPSGSFDNCIKALRKPISQRTHEDLELIAEALKSFKYLANSAPSSSDPERAFIALAKNVTYQHFNTSQVLFHKGDPDNQIYLVLRGNGVIFNEVAGDVFKVATMVTEEPKEDKQSLNSKLSRGTTVDEGSNKMLFQPKITKKLVRQLTSIGDITTPSHASLRIIPTVHDVKKVLNESYSPESPENEAINLHENGTRLGSPDSPARGDREAKKRIALYKLLLKAEKERPGKYVKDGQFLFQAKKKIGPGMHFGEIASRNTKTRAVTAIAYDEMDVISFKLNDYTVLFNNHGGQANNNVRFLEGFFPDASYPKLLKLLDLFEEFEYPQRQMIFEEDTPVDALYLIKEGEIQLLKSLDTSKYTAKEDKALPANIRKKCCIATVGKGEALGEEDFFFGQKRHYSGIVTSVKVVVLRLSKQVYDEISEVYRELFDAIRKTAKAKMNFKKEHVKNITQQVVHLAHHIEDLKHRSTQNTKYPQLKFTEGKDPVFYISGDQRGANKLRSRSGSPIRPGESPVGDAKGPLNFSEGVNNLIGSSPKRSKEVIESMSKLPVLSPKSNTKEILESPLKSRNVSPQNSDNLLALKPCVTEVVRPQSQLNGRPRLSRKHSKSGVTSLIPEGSSLYREALGNVRRRKPINLPREKLGPMSTKNHVHKLYMGELEKSVQILAKSNMQRNNSNSPIGEHKFVTLSTSPLKMNKEKSMGSIWEGVTLENEEPPKILPSTLIKEKVSLKVENDLIDKYRQSKEAARRASQHKVIHLEQVSCNNLLPSVANADLSLQHHKSVTNLSSHAKGLARRQLGSDSYQETKSLMHKRKSQPKLDDLLATLEPESFEVEPLRTGFKPSKIFSMKLQYRTIGNNSKGKAKKFWDLK